jgi:uncharacterized protein (DUF2141 family)
MVSISVSGIGSAAPTRGSAISGRKCAAAALLVLLLPAAAPTSSLELSFENLRSHKGVLRVCLAPDAKNFPDCKDKARTLARSLPATGAPMRFEGIPQGDWAVSALHDENGNGKLDTMAGIPREGFGFSRNPAIGFGAPGFAATRFAVAVDPARQRIRMRYLF